MQVHILILSALILLSLIGVRSIYLFLNDFFNVNDPFPDIECFDEGAHYHE